MVADAQPGEIPLVIRTAPITPERTVESLTVSGRAVVYRLFDVGGEIHLDRALDRLATSAPERVRPTRVEAQALQIPNPPITCALGPHSLNLPDARTAEVSARIFDFGVISLRARVESGGPMSWNEFTRFGRAVDAAKEIPALLEQQARALVERMGDAIERPYIAHVREDYVVYHITNGSDDDGSGPVRAMIQELDLAPLLLGETQPLSEDARREMLPNRFSYYADDLAILSWDNALIVEPSNADSDVEYILEFANAQLLELRYYDAVLDAELPKLYDRIATARKRRRRVFGAGYAHLLGTMQTLVAEITELVERAENALKVTDDVYLARIYSAALELYRGRVWRTGIDRKLTIIRDTYAMLNGEIQARRAELLEIAIIVLIVFEIVLSLIQR
jgi:hypothetical protein